MARCREEERSLVSIQRLIGSPIKRITQHGFEVTDQEIKEMCERGSSNGQDISFEDFEHLMTKTFSTN